MDQQKTLLQKYNEFETKARRISGYKIILDKKALQNHLAYPETISGNISLLFVNKVTYQNKIQEKEQSFLICGDISWQRNTIESSEEKKVPKV